MRDVVVYLLKEALEDNAMLDLWVMGHTADGHERMA